MVFFHERIVQGVGEISCPTSCGDGIHGPVRWVFLHLRGCSQSCCWLMGRVGAF